MEIRLVMTSKINYYLYFLIFSFILSNLHCCLCFYLNVIQTWISFICKKEIRNALVISTVPPFFKLLFTLSNLCLSSLSLIVFLYPTCIPFSQDISFISISSHFYISIFIVYFYFFYSFLSLNFSLYLLFLLLLSFVFTNSFQLNMYVSQTKSITDPISEQLRLILWYYTLILSRKV